MTARGVVQFGQDASHLRKAAKALMLEVLNVAGMRHPDIEKWTFTAAGNEVSMEGELSDEGLRMLLGVVQSPMPASSPAVAGARPPKGGVKPAKAAPPADPAVASQRYYKSVTTILDGLEQGTSLSQTSTWFRNSARRIDTLPILNVDPELVQWAAAASTKLKQVAGVASVGQLQVSASVAGAQAGYRPYGTYDYDDNGDYRANRANRAEAEANRQQRRHAALEKRAQAQAAGLQILNELVDARAKVRADMTAKYKVEF
jgi:hypothetical protein